ncbi:hypothetical protein N7507_006826 [Penicillium longicatenatum]|nr:hypothetical protein N7507_006826 [Penicillium longicatenatum]
MSHIRLPMNLARSSGLLCYPPKPHSSHQSTLSSSAVVSPAMETTCSSDGSVYDESAYGYFNQPNLSFTTAPYTGMANTAPISDVDWTARNLSCISETEDNPSLSSSYEFMDLRKDEPPAWDNMSYQPQVPFMPISNDKAIEFQPPNPQFQSQFQECPTTWNTEMCMQAYTENVDQPSTYFESSTDWRQQFDQPMAQDYKLLQTMSITPDEQPIIHHQSAQISTYTHSHTTTMALPQEQLSRTSFNYTTPFPGANNIHQSHPQLPTGANDHPQPQHPTAVQQIEQHTPESVFHNSSPHVQPQIQPQPQPQIQSQAPNTLKATLHYTDTRNAFLIDCKRRGLSYKEIKRVGGFKEAESTLRGRFRTLTKSKDQRVRKPKWLERDVHLLVEGVSMFMDKNHYDEGDDVHSDLPVSVVSQNQNGEHSSQNQAHAPKVSWKKVAQFIWARGGSYQFGNATCKKKWCEIYGVKI